MYKISKRMEISAAHKLNLDYVSPCQRLHGHNYLVTVYCRAGTLDRNGMVVDFAKVKNMVHDVLDHGYLNEIFPSSMNPTAENMARWICDVVTNLCETGECYRVDVQETEGNIATYEKED